MPIETVSKRQAARTLCDAAADAYLDRDDFLATIVLAGAAEDVLAGFLKQEKPPSPSARDQMVSGIRQFAALEHPPVLLSENEGHKQLRVVFNWLRHNDDSADPQVLEADFQEEALEVLDRALTNWLMVTGEPHPRFGELANPN